MRVVMDDLTMKNMHSHIYIMIQFKVEKKMFLK
jgi:hypothetical protein